MVMNPTSVTPSINAAAVIAVRFGFRPALSRASVPVIPLMARQRRTQSVRQRSGDERRLHDDAGEHEHRTHTDQVDLAADIAEQTEAQEPGTEREDRKAHDHARPDAHRSFERDVPERGDRRDARRRSCGQEGGQRRDRHPDRQCDDDGARLDDDAAARDVDPDEREQRLQGARHQHAAHDAEHRGKEADDQRLCEHGSQHLPATRPDRAEQRQLAGALGNDDAERVVDDEDRDEERDHREDRQRDVEEAQLPARPGPGSHRRPRHP